ncbi:hypothetical protein BS78_05G086200 [Paspalum vaginatum]|nr:hypothetical protein BS78_05G086200 [Paspalum vaginatum]
MPTGQTRAPPPPSTASSSSAAATHRRHRTFSSSSSSSSSSLSTASSAASSPSPSPRGRATTSVPFSWEHHPGIPKALLLPAGTASSSTPAAATPLPLPPPPSRPRHHHHQHPQTRRRRASGGSRPPADASGDPFAAALAECTRPDRSGSGPDDDDARLMDALFPPRAPSAAAAPIRRWSAGGVVALLDLHGCKSATMCVAEGAAFVARRPVAVAARPAGRAGLGRPARR